MKLSPSEATRLLWVCVPTGNTSGITMALEQGANVNHANKRGRTPLHRACRAPDPDPRVVRILLRAGANPSAVDAKGRTPVEYAREALLERQSPPDDPLDAIASRDRAARALDMPEEELMEDFEREGLANAAKEMSPEDYKEFRALYVASRREAASRCFYDTARLERVVELLDAAVK